MAIMKLQVRARKATFADDAFDFGIFAIANMDPHLVNWERLPTEHAFVHDGSQLYGAY
jgi:hypothetical protein